MLWRAIKLAKEDGAARFDMGRSDCDNAGLVSFKERWGGQRSEISYFRYPAPKAESGRESWKIQLAKRAFSRMPNVLLSAAGKALYKHVG